MGLVALYDEEERLERTRTLALSSLARTLALPSPAMCSPPQPPELALPSPAMSGHGLPSSRSPAMCRPPLGGDALGHVLLGVQRPRASAAPRPRGPGRWVGPRVGVRGQAGLGGLQRGGEDRLGLPAEAARGRRCTTHPGHLGATHACLRAGGPTALHALPRSRPARLAAVRILWVTPWGPAHSGDCPGCSPPANLGYLSSLSSSPPPASALFVTPLYSSFLSVTFRHLRLGSACCIFSHLCCALTNFVNLRHCPSVSVTFRQFSPLSVPLRRPSAALGSSPSGIVYFRHSPSLSGCSLPHTPGGESLREFSCP
ncbi:uncharacterized protein [Symphalangus syndactylus]|uniref:uncharacterized protein n=1 Tax=Symphalangus syndactylus TaxID=9590 RepID=UPI003005E303